MSTDNFIAIIKKGRSYTGYHCWASHDYPFVKCYPCLGTKKFETTKLRDAIDLAQAIYTEYGVSVHNWKDEVTEECPCELKRFIIGGLFNTWI